MEPKQKEYPAVDVTGDRSKVQCCKEQYCIGTWNVRSMNQGKLEEVKQEMARVNVDILGISELKWKPVCRHYIFITIVRHRLETVSSHFINVLNFSQKHSPQIPSHLIGQNCI